MLCKDCEHFKILYEPLRTTGVCWDFGKAVCNKHNLITDFLDHRKFNTLSCIEEVQKGADTDGQKAEAKAD